MLIVGTRGKSRIKEVILGSTTKALVKHSPIPVMAIPENTDQKDFDKIKNHPLLTVIGHACDNKAGCQLITGLGHQIEISAQGWQSFS